MIYAVTEDGNAPTVYATNDAPQPEVIATTG